MYTVMLLASARRNRPRLHLQTRLSRRGETFSFVKLSVRRSADQLTRPFLQPPQALRPHLPIFGCKSKVQTTVGPFDHKFSTLRLKSQYANYGASNVVYKHNWAQGSNTQACLWVPAWGSKASNLALMLLEIAQLS